MRNKFLTVLGPLIVFGIFVPVVNSGGSDSGSSNTTSSAGGSTENSSSKKAETTEISVSAGVLIDAFKDNEPAAEKKYKGQWLRVSGQVDKIDTEMFDDEKYRVRIGTGADFELFMVSCSGFDVSDVEELSKGEKSPSSVTSMTAVT